MTPTVRPPILADIEKYCNNFFNPQNDPDSPVRDYPDGFLILASRIEQYHDNPANFNGSGDENLYTSWQPAFARELALYKRARFI